MKKVINSQTQICLIVGDPISQSLSPVMHNEAYRALGIEDKFIYVAASVPIEKLEDAVKAVRLFNIRGLTCTVPHKVEVLKYLDEVDPTAQKIGAVNTVVNENGKLIGYNTDWLGVVLPLTKITKLKDKKVAVLGAGGAARAVVYGLIKESAEVTIFNRTLSNAKELAREFGCQAKSLTEIEEVKNFDIIINTTTVGMSPDTNSLVPEEFLTKKQIVFDCVYKPVKTKLLRDAENAGAKTITGLEMLLYQGVEQFKLYTGVEAPIEVMRKTLLEYSQ